MRTRTQTRNLLVKKYGKDTANVVMAASRFDNKRLAVLRRDLGIGRVAAILANDSRGTYDWAF